jgi:hypothetical protein
MTYIANGYPFSPWGRWFPWYSSGYGYGYGYVTMDPWRYGTAYWVFGQNGLWWYDPYSYGGYGSDYGYYNPTGYTTSLQSWSPQSPTGETGSLRLRVSPSSAKVYVDGALKGSVDEFDGLSHHLDVATGEHHLEIKADGYETYTTDIVVENGKTFTVRASLKKK